MMRWKWLVWLYPPTWRERYSEEFEALLEHYQFSPLGVLDVLLGALDARICLAGESLLIRRIDDMSWLRHRKELMLAATMVIAAGVIDLAVMLLAAFAWFEGVRATASLVSAAGIAATFGFVVIAARRLHEVRGREA